MNRIVLTIMSTLAASAAIVVAGAYAFVNSGLYDVSATTPDSQLVYWVAHQTMEHSIARRLGQNIVPARLDAPVTIAAGGALYVKNCMVCHGAPQVDRTAISKGLNPQPPNLFLATRKPDAAENFQFIKHGVKMSGMPGFAGTMTDDQVWSLVAFLNMLPGQNSADFEQITRTEIAPGLPATGKGG